MKAMLKIIQSLLSIFAVSIAVLLIGHLGSSANIMNENNVSNQKGMESNTDQRSLHFAQGQPPYCYLGIYRRSTSSTVILYNTL